MVPARTVAGLRIAITSAAPDIAAQLRSALVSAGAEARIVDRADTTAAITILTEGYATLSPASRHWQALAQSRGARASGATVIALEPAHASPSGTSGLGGLARTLRKEWPEARFVTWTFETGADTIAAASLSALGAGLGDALITGLAMSRHIHIADTLHPPHTAGAPRGSWLITGGARGVTAACAIELARRSGAGAHFFLAGRSQAAPWPAQIPHTHDLKTLRASFAALARDSGQKISPRDIDREARRALAGLEISETLAAIRASGATASYVALDVANPDAVRRTLAALTGEHGPITGLVHGAGVLADRLAADKTEADVQTVFGPKVDGLCHLLAALPERALTHIGLFSSASALFGNTGQADYAMANQVLVNLARSLSARAPQIRSVAFDWGPWEGGMVDATLAGHFKAQGISLIPVAEGARIFADQLMSGDPDTVEILVGDAWSGE